MGIEKEAILSCMYYEILEVHKQRWDIIWFWRQILGNNNDSLTQSRT